MAASPIELMTREPALVDRKSFPLTMGLPFATGALPVNVPLSIEDETGRPLPLQTRVMETHEDGSVRWVLLDFLADLAAGEKSRHKLVVGRERETNGAVIDTREDGSRLMWITTC